ncbi:MAG: acetate--CoA ligase family protein [Reyranella sp.]|nr:acetate--CoA ligase family protein [Reyranella sp.]
MDALIRPRTIAVIGASPRRQTLGNVALDNLANYGFAGTVIPVHGEAAEIAGRPAVPSIEALPDGVDVALASVPAAGVADAVRRLDRRGVRTAIVNTAGFSPEQEAELRQLVSGSRILMHGPNCMGLINLSDATPIYTGGITSRVRKGPVALIAQSGSAAISVINSSTAGFSKVVTIGSEFRVTGSDYLQWLAGDPDTSAIGLILESIQDADRFADAVDRVHAAGKSLVMLKVGRSATGARATLAHTGALIRNDDAFAGFVARYGIPVVGDYEELIATLEALAVCTKRPRRGALALMGISGGETALACDICDQVDLPLAIFSEATAAGVRAALPGLPGQNPVDIGQSVGRQQGAALAGMTAVMTAEEVGVGVVLQDMQASLPATSHRNYTGHLTTIAELSRATDKPIVVVSPTAEIMSERLLACLEGTGVPALRGLRPGLAAVKCMVDWSARRLDARRLADRRITPERASLQREIAALRGSLPRPLVGRLLDSYGIPVVKSAVARSADEAVIAARKIGYPLVVKVMSADVPHRSDVGAVQLGIENEAGLRAAVALIERNVREKVPGAVIDGYELQEELVDCLQAMVGYQAAPPYGALTIVGSGGVLVELEADKALSLSPVTTAEAGAMLASTRLGKTLGGYRNLIPVTNTAPLAGLIASLSALAADFCDLVPECDLNPVLIRKGSGDVRIVDALFVAGGR